MHFSMKNILKSNRNYKPKQALRLYQKSKWIYTLSQESK